MKDIEIARGAAAHAGFAFAGQADAGAGFDARRDVDARATVFFDAACTATGFAGVLDDLTHAGTGRAGAFNREEALLRAHFAHAGTGRAGVGSAPPSAPDPSQDRTRPSRHVDGFLQAGKASSSETRRL